MEIGNVKPDAGQIIRGEANAGGTGVGGTSTTNTSGAGVVNTNVNHAAAASAQAERAPVTNTEALKELLISYGQKPAEDNISLIRALIEAGLSPDKGNFLKLNQALKLFNIVSEEGGSQANIDKAIFALKNNLPTTMESAQKFQAFIGEAGNVSNNIEELFSSLNSAPKNSAVEQIMRIFANSLPRGFGALSLNGAEPETAQAAAAKATVISTGATAEGAVAKTGAEPAAHNVATGTLGAEHGRQAAVQDASLTALQDGLPAEVRGELVRELAEILSRPGSTASPEQTEKLVADFLAKQLNSAKPFSESELLSVLGQLSKERPEIAGLLTRLMQRLDSGARTPINQAEFERAFEGFRLKPPENEPRLLEETLNSLKFKSEEALKIANNSPEEVPAALTKALENITNNLSFIDQLKTCVYIPIPLNTPTGHAEGELYIFKDGGRGSSGKRAAKTALIGLNTVSLGRVEAYIHKDENRLNLQFRLEETSTAELFSKHYNELIELLDSAGLKLVGLSTTGLDAPFTLTDAEESKRSEAKWPEHKFDIKA